MLMLAVPAGRGNRVTSSLLGSTRTRALSPPSVTHGAPWVTDGGLNALVRVDPRSDEVTRFPLPAGTANISMNTAAFGRDGTLWFTGQAGYYGRLDPASGRVEVF